MLTIVINYGYNILATFRKKTNKLVVLEFCLSYVVFSTSTAYISANVEAWNIYINYSILF